MTREINRAEYNLNKRGFAEETIAKKKGGALISIPDDDIKYDDERSI